MRDKATIGFSFDDGRSDNYTVINQIMIPLNLPTTLNITTGYIDGTCPENLLPSNKTALTIEQIIELYHSNMVEIALHGDRHLNTIEDIQSGKEKLIQWIDISSDIPLGFASPGSGMSVDYFRQSDDRFLKEEVLYLRSGLRINHYGWLRALCRKASRILHLPFLYRTAYKDTLMECVEDRVLFSIPVMKTITLKEVKSLIDFAIDHKKIIILMFHSILNDVSSEDNWSWSLDKYQELCTYISQKQKNGQAEVLTSNQIYQKYKKRET